MEKYAVVDATWDATIMVWPDGCWCYEDEFPVYSCSLSDDYATLRLAADPSGETIEEIVEAHVNRSYL